MSDKIQVVLLDDVRRVYDDLPPIEVGVHSVEGFTWYRPVPESGGGIIGGAVIEIPADRLHPWHTVIIREDSWHLVHPVDCNLAVCIFDHQAQEWGLPPRRVGTYRWDADGLDENDIGVTDETD